MTASRILFKGQLYVRAQDPAEEPTVEAAPEGEAPAEAAPEGEAAAGEAGAEAEELAGIGEPDVGAEADLAEGEEVKPEDPSKTIKEIESSPAANWRDYLQPLIRDLKVRFNGKPVSLLNPEMMSESGDPDLGFYITGYLKFLEETPKDIIEEYGDVPIHFKVFVDPKGKLHRESIELYTELDTLG